MTLSKFNMKTKIFVALLFAAVCCTLAVPAFGLQTLGVCAQWSQFLPGNTGLITKGCNEQAQIDPDFDSPCFAFPGAVILKKFTGTSTIKGPSGESNLTINVHYPDGSEIEIGRAHQWTMTGGAHVDWNTILPDGGMVLPTGCSISYTLFGYQISEVEQEIGVTGKGAHKKILYKQTFPSNGLPLNFEVGQTFFFEPVK